MRCDWVRVFLLFGKVWRGDDGDGVNGKRTGMKVLPSSKIPLARGLVLHDCHAEVEQKRNTPWTGLG